MTVHHFTTSHKELPRHFFWVKNDVDIKYCYLANQRPSMFISPSFQNFFEWNNQNKSNKFFSLPSISLSKIYSFNVRVKIGTKAKIPADFFFFLPVRSVSLQYNWIASPTCYTKQSNAPFTPAKHVLLKQLDAEKLKFTTSHQTSVSATSMKKAKRFFRV